jgi:hypothetical protein
MAETLRAEDLLAKRVHSSDHVLLINPPVEETRYSWVRWNQPLDLLKLGQLLTTEVGCRVSLVDHMRPDPAWKVPFEFLPASRRYYELGGEQYPMRRFGRPYKEIHDWKREQSRGGEPEPSQVWITSLCSYWFDAVAQMSRSVRECFPHATAVLVGNYPRLLPAHASERCAVDNVVIDSFEKHDHQAMFELYGDNAPPFVALEVHSPVAAKELQNAFSRKILDFTFFDEDVFIDGGRDFERLLEVADTLDGKIRFHLICGVHPQCINPRTARLLANKRVVAVHFEELGGMQSLAIDVYRAVQSYLTEAGLSWPSDKISGFVWIGRPGERLEDIILKCFQVLELIGSLILKPYSPTPGSPEFLRYERELSTIPLRNFSPHLFPFNEINNISRKEYHDLYRMAAFLNEKVRNRAFNFFNGTLGTKLLLESLKKEAWKIEKPKSAFRVIDYPPGVRHSVLGALESSIWTVAGCGLVAGQRLCP